MDFPELIRRLRFLRSKRARERELQEEMLLHRELRASQIARHGIEPADAAVMASRLFGNQTLLKEKANDMWGWCWLEDLGRDVRQTGRMLAANRGFASIAILTLALGIGANTAIFSVTNALLLRTLPVHDPQQLYRVRCDRQPNNASNTGNSETSFSDFVFQHLRTDKNAVSDLMAYVPLGFNKISVRAGKLPEEAAADMVSGNFFSGLGVRPVCGRVLSGQDESTNASVAVISYGYAARRFGEACSTIGKPIYVKGLPFTVVGVVARGFTGWKRLRPTYGFHFKHVLN